MLCRVEGVVPFEASSIFLILSLSLLCLSHLLQSGHLENSKDSVWAIP